MFQNLFLTRIPYSSYLQQGKKILELILPSDLILLAYIGLLKGNKFDPMIFQILNSDLLLLLLFSF
jgi:putative effector of murein hydrolase